MTSLSKTYYVSSKTGNDSNDGLTEENAFASLFAINHMSLQPGDKVLLERGSVFYGQYLQVTDSGSKDALIVIGAYGDGNAPRIEACGQGIWYQDYGNPLDAPTHVYHGYVSSAVLLYDAGEYNCKSICEDCYLVHWVAIGSLQKIDIRILTQIP